MSYQFQRQIFRVSGYGVPGEVYNNGPIRSQPYIVNSADATNNVVARAFTITAEGKVQAGNPAGNAVLAGIMVNPKAYALYGNVSSPTLTVPNNIAIEIASMGSFFVMLPAAAAIGDAVIYDNITGELETVAPGAALPTGKSPLYAEVDVFTVADAGLAVITMTKLPPVPVGGGPVTSNNYTNRDGDDYVSRDGDNYVSPDEAGILAESDTENQDSKAARKAAKKIKDAEKLAKANAILDGTDENTGVK